MSSSIQVVTAQGLEDAFIVKYITGLCLNFLSSLSYADYSLLVSQLRAL
jgi:drug/metabolite transporter (DMT)-like permease